ncbi:hypothetical protein UA08_06624 [Talaromyces atroroseus]|uniref:Uncharacterized protein n=1 Tax=Talaromyces atroroseus TaxID=1441469 RepID=A0A225ALF5_TALAT|nr:hypothetical protein UA08_06624 [Talaromyces atroroseus]OKL58078.1 hypothetical protein UA08_06624 [Talaromyces atroroseus]
MPSETTVSAETFESEIYNRLLETSTLDDLHANLLFSLQRAGWAERIQSLSLELLRAGRCTHFDDMVDIVVTLATGQTHPAVPEANNNSSNNANATANGHSGTNSFNGNTANNSESFFRDIDVRIPKEIVEQGVRALRDSIRPFAVIEDDEDGSEADGGGSHNIVGAKELPNGAKNSSKSDKKQNKSSKDSASTGKSNDANTSPTKNLPKDKKIKPAGKGAK